MKTRVDPAGVERYAGVVRRVGAFCIDMLLVCLWLLGLGLFISKGVYSSLANAIGLSYAEPVISFVCAIAFIFAILYFPLLESSRLQATIGKKVMGIVVVSDDGKRLTFDRAMARTIVACFFAIASLPWMVYTGKRPVQDIMLHCVVLRKKESETSPYRMN